MNLELTPYDAALIRKALNLWNDTVLCDLVADIPDRADQYRAICRIDHALGGPAPAPADDDPFGESAERFGPWDDEE